MTAAELGEFLHRGSDTCALDELPRALLLHTGGVGYAAVTSLLAHADGGGELLCTVLHLPVVKKEPSWLVRNSRPVLLEACAKRAEATVQFRRLMFSLELTGSAVSEKWEALWWKPAESKLAACGVSGAQRGH